MSNYNLSKIELNDLIPEATKAILEYGATMLILQKKLKLGYVASTQLMEELEKRHIVGKFNGSKPREILEYKNYMKGE